MQFDVKLVIVGQFRMFVGILFQITVPEYAILPLNSSVLGFGVIKFILLYERKFFWGVPCFINNSLIYTYFLIHDT